MQHKGLYFAFLTVTTSLLGWSPVQAEVIRLQRSAENLMVVVSDDSWQPENFVNGTTIPATYVKQAGITLDGAADHGGHDAGDARSAQLRRRKSLGARSHRDGFAGARRRLRRRR